MSSVLMKIGLLSYILALFLSPNIFHGFKSNSSTQLDSLIHEKNSFNSDTQVELLVLYQRALKEKRADSIQIFKNLALLNADLVQPSDAIKFTQKYIDNTLDFSILKNQAYDGIRDYEEYDILNKKYNIRINLISFLFLYAALIGFSFTVLVYFLKAVKSSTKFFISGFVGVHSLFVLEFVLYITNIRLRFPHAYLMASTVALWYGPFLYFYFRSLTANFRFRIKDLLHFLPNILLILYLLPIYSLEAPDKLRVMLRLDDSYTNYRNAIFATKLVSLTVYAFMIGKLYYRNRQNASVIHNGMILVNKWKRNIYRIHVAYVGAYMVYGLSAIGFLGLSTSFITTYVMVAIMAVMIFYIAYMSYLQPGLFTENIRDISTVYIAKYQKSGLTDSLSEELKEKMFKLFQEDKIYKQSSLNLDKLSEEIGTTRHNTSQIINEHFNMNFFELINKFRIQESIEILRKDKNHNLNIIDVAFEVGYNNKATFNKAFKKETSLTPTQFLSLKDNYKVSVNFG